jgi:glutamate dehydrogenase (NAD(P)+)
MGTPIDLNVWERSNEMCARSTILTRRAAARLMIPEQVKVDLVESLRVPERSIPVTIRVVIDGVRSEIMGWRVCHTSLGMEEDGRPIKRPFGGGTRFAADGSEAEAFGLAKWMTGKYGAAAIPLGGAKAVVCIDPGQVDERVLGKVSMSFMCGLLGYVGPGKDVLATDIGTSPRIMAYMQEAYHTAYPHGGLAVAGLENEPTAQGRGPATGYGMVHVSDLVLRERGRQLGPDVSVMISGMGKVGAPGAEGYARRGCRVVGVCDDSVAFYHPKGLDAVAASEYALKYGSLKGFCPGLGTECMSPREMLGAGRVTMLAVCSTEGVIGQEEARAIDAEFLVEGANDPLRSEGEDVLTAKGVEVVNGDLANAGGAYVSYLGRLQQELGQVWRAEEVLVRMYEGLNRAHRRQLDVMEHYELGRNERRFASTMVAMDFLSKAFMARRMGGRKAPLQRAAVG